ncbi:methyl-accepting chemotaxis protein [Aerosakkonema sp. BLCC-F183]|uniref:methyl-accepting chemotaxis protein n=1 Tax=Aerosakkonema sp. BLCC-F183 TaxID=3342834 RepID=UPI0035BAA75A
MFVQDAILSKNKGIEGKLISGFLVIGGIVLIVGLIGLLGTNRLSGHINTIGENAFPSVFSLWKVNEAQSAADAALLAQFVPTISPQKRQEELKNLEDAFSRYKEGLEDYDKLKRDPEEDNLYRSAKPSLDKWKSTIDQAIELNNEFRQYDIEFPGQERVDLLLAGKRDTPEYARAQAAADAQKKVYQYITDVERPAFNEGTAQLLKLLNYNENLADRARSTAQKDVGSTTFWSITTMLVGTGIAVLFGFYFSNTIAKPMGAKIAGVVTVAERIAAGDLSTSVPSAESNDEIGRLQNAFRNMIKNLSSFISQVQRSGIQVTTSTTQIAASGKELEATVAEQAASTKEVAATAQEISATSRKLSRTMEQVATLAQSTAVSAGSSQKDLSSMENVMRQLAEATTSISSKLGIMNEKANNINNVVTTITKVADQTNLLSLNAAIEAEKAGEYGAGFAVVAREIRRLADQTAVATLEIEQMVKEMQSAVSTGVMEMDKFNKAVNDSVEKVVNIGEQLALVIQQVQGLTPRFEEVSQSMEEQSQGAQQISEAMEQLTQASQQTSDALRETNSAVSQLDDAAQGLQAEIRRFKV